MKKEKVTTTPAVPAVQHRKFIGEVVAISGAKTISVLVKSVKTHAKYRKQYIESKKYPVHDEKNVAVVGNTVAFEECRPLSARKRWRITQVIS